MSVGLSVHCVCVWVCLCVSGGPVGSAGGHEAGGQGSSDALASPFMGRGALEGFDDVGSDGEAEDTGWRDTRLEVLRPRCSAPRPIPGVSHSSQGLPGYCPCPVVRQRERRGQALES